MITMTPKVDSFDLASLHLASGEGRRLTLGFTLEPFELGGETYVARADATEEPAAGAAKFSAELIPCRLDVSRTTNSGYVLRLRFSATLEGPCMRCLEPAAPTFSVDAAEVSHPGETDEEFTSPYVTEDGVLDLGGWARDALVLAFPATILCRPDCAGLCAICGADLNQAGPEHQHEAEPDSRWAKLSEIHFE
jgi:uncharacterized protein